MIPQAQVNSSVSPVPKDGAPVASARWT
jgi:hypothetical protein